MEKPEQGLAGNYKYDNLTALIDSDIDRRMDGIPSSLLALAFLNRTNAQPVRDRHYSLVYIFLAVPRACSELMIEATGFRSPDEEQRRLRHQPTTAN
jgi:hypothetical protein